MRSPDAALSDASPLSDSISTTICRPTVKAPIELTRQKEPLSRVTSLTARVFACRAGPIARADPAHWLTLDVAAAALEDAGFPEGEGLPREATGVFIGNTLTGEFSRANTMRLRWPYVRRVVRKVLEENEWPEERQRELLAQMETLYKKPFPPVGAETLAWRPLQHHRWTHL